MLVPLLSYAQTDRSNGETGGIPADAVLEPDAANYNNTRSNRSAIAPPTNLCDGVTCPDGSCAATVDECATEAARAPGAPVCPDGGGDCDDTDPAVRPDQATCGLDEDCDGMVDEEPVLMENVERVENQNASQSNRTEPVAVDAYDTDDDGDGLDDGTERAQNHNSSRSNRTSPVAVPDEVDSDDDEDGLPTVRSATADDKASPLLYTSLRASTGNIDGVPLVFDRLETSTQSEVAIDPNTNEPRLTRVAVSAADMRSWNEDDRVAFEVVVAEAPEGTPEQASLKIIEQVLNDERIESLEVSEAGAQAQYRASLRLFGFIPIEREVRASIDDQGSVEIDYPWYSFLATKPASDTIQSLLQRTRDILVAE